MGLNPYFNNIDENIEQDLAADLVEECIQINGFDVNYVPRTYVSTDMIFGENPASKFKHAYVIEVYMESFMKDQGEGTLLSKFGLEQRDAITLIMSKRRFTESVTEFQPDYDRPREGDIIQIPFMKNGYYEIRFVDDRVPFYQFGDRYTYKIKAELMRYSSEEFDVDIPELNDINRKRNTGSTVQEPYAINDIFEEAADGPETTDGHNNQGNDNRGSGVINFDESSPFGDF